MNFHSDNNLKIDKERGKKVAKILYEAFVTKGIFEKKEMPEDILPNNMEKGSLHHILFITLTVSIDYQRDAPSLWESSRNTYYDSFTRYLFDPKSLHETPFKKIEEDLQRYNLSKKPRKDAQIWRTLGVTLLKKWGGNPLNFIDDCDWDSNIILRRLRTDTHEYNNRMVTDFPYLRGPKIGPLWLRMLRDNIGITKLNNLEKVPIPVDIHVARATLSTGVVRGYFCGRLDEISKDIRKVWYKSTKDLKIRERNMIALDVDEPLWHLSKYGCTSRDKISGQCPERNRCEVRDFCVKGRIRFDKDKVELDT